MMYHWWIKRKSIQTVLPVRMKRMINLMHDPGNTLQEALRSVSSDDVPHCPPIRIPDQPQSVVADTFDCRERISRLASVQKNHVEVDIPVFHHVEKMLEIRRERDIIFNDYHHVGFARHQSFERLPVTDSAGDHSARQGFPALLFSCLRVDQCIVLLGQFLPVLGTQDLGFNIEGLKLSVHRLATGSGSRKTDNDASHLVRISDST